MATTETTRQRCSCRVGEWPAADVERAIRITPSSYFRWKRSVDCILAAIALIPALPLIGLLVLLVRLTSRGPGIYRQVRVGKQGRLFTMYKIRSMAANAEAGTGAVWAKRRDPRVTLIGRILRALHLDELPQLFNVLQGEMSLVGPRPERPEFVRTLSAKIPGYCDRLAVSPGITGLAQLNLPPDTDLNSVRRKLFLDLEYVAHGGLFLELRLLACTFLRAMKVHGPLVLRLFCLHREVPDSVCEVTEATPSSPLPYVVWTGEPGQGDRSEDRAGAIGLMAGAMTAGGRT